MKKSKLTQNEKIKAHLLKYKSITTMQAFTKFKITRLSARIFNLRDSGMDISSERVSNKKEGTWWCKYYI